MSGAKILYRKIIHGTGHSFSYFRMPFVFPLHTHGDYELIFMREGSGLQFVGNSVRRYKKGDLVLIGSDVPHLHLCDSVRNGIHENIGSCEILQFPADIFPERMGDIPEYSHIYSLLRKSRQGVFFTSDEIVGKAVRMMRKMENKNGIERITSLLVMLELLGMTDEYGVVSASDTADAVDSVIGRNKTGLDPVELVCRYLSADFSKKMSLERIAERAGMNPSSLCRCFKRKTGKTIFEYLTEIRVEQACRLLRTTDRTVSQIAYDVGFGNISHFNKSFRGVTRQTPSEYRRNILL